MTFPTTIAGTLGQSATVDFELTGVHAISVLPDLMRFDLPEEGLVTWNEVGIAAQIERLVRVPDGSGGFTEQWQFFTFVDLQLDVPANEATPSELDSATFLQTPETDFTAFVNDITGIEHTEQYRITVIFESSPAQELADLLTSSGLTVGDYTPSIRALLALDTPNGQRSASWGGWIETVPVTSGDPPPPPGELPYILSPDLPTAPIPDEFRWTEATPGELRSPLIEFDVDLGAYRLDVWDELVAGGEWGIAEARDVLVDRVTGIFIDGAAGFLDDLGVRFGILNLGQTLRDTAEFGQELFQFHSAILNELDDLLGNFESRSIEDLRGAEERIQTAADDFFTNVQDSVSEPAASAIEFIRMGLFEVNSHNMVANAADAAFGGTENTDAMLGGIFGDVLNGLGGADLLLGGDGDDELQGGSGEDRLLGGRGDDTLVGGNDADILDGGGGSDSAAYTGNRVDYVVSGTATNFTITDGVGGRDGADTVLNVEFVEFADGTFSIDDLLNPPGAEAANDFDGDGDSDILFQHTAGPVYQYQMDGFSVTGAGFAGFNADPDWQVVATGDFDDNGSDILFQHTNGQLYQYQMDGLSVTAAGFVGFNSDPNWQVVASGDFGGDGRSDILFQHTNGQVYQWQMDGFSITGAGFVGFNTDPNWQVVATGDFGGDGRSDILFQHTNGQLYQYQMDGFSVTGAGFVGSNTDPNWQVVGTGDFDGDGNSDILFQHTGGQLYQYQMDGLSVTGAGFVGFNNDPNWQVAATGDYNGDGRSDVLFQHTNGQLYEWQLDGFSVTGAGFVGSNADPGWQIVP